MEKIPFSVESWKSGKYDAITRNDIKIKSLLIHEVDCLYPICSIDERDDPLSHTVTGRFIHSEDNSKNDLFLIPRKRKLWIAVDVNDKDSSYISVSNAFQSRKDLLDTYKVEIISQRFEIIQIEVEFPECNT